MRKTGMGRANTVNGAQWRVGGPFLARSVEASGLFLVRSAEANGKSDEKGDEKANGKANGKAKRKVERKVNGEAKRIVQSAKELQYQSGEKTRLKRTRRYIMKAPDAGAKDGKAK